eukprot:1185398-Prorocentrum_minimum.AAC.2
MIKSTGPSGLPWLRAPHCLHCAVLYFTVCTVPHRTAPHAPQCDVMSALCCTVPLHCTTSLRHCTHLQHGPVGLAAAAEG